MPLSKTGQKIKQRTLLKQQGEPRDYRVYRDLTPDPARWMTREMVMNRLCLDEKQMKRLESDQKLTSERKNSAGYALYAVSEVERVAAARRSGELTIGGTIGAPAGSPMTCRYRAEDGQIVFKMLSDGISLIQIIIETGIHPDAVEAIQKKYQKFSGVIVISGDIVNEMNRVQLPGRFPLTSASDILELLQSLEEDHQCPSCMKQMCARQCAKCIIRMNRKQENAVGLVKRVSPALAAPSPASPPASDPSSGQLPIHTSSREPEPEPDALITDPDEILLSARSK